MPQKNKKRLVEQNADDVIPCPKRRHHWLGAGRAAALRQLYQLDPADAIREFGGGIFE